MIKLFFKNRILLFCEKESPIHNSAKVLHLDDKTDQAVKLFLTTADDYNLEICGASDNDAMEVMARCVRIIPAAGGRVHDEFGKILFINRFERWDLPKGWLEDGETIAECAVREVCEECGMKPSDLINEGPLTKTFHIYPFNDGFALKETHWFAMKYVGDGMLKPQKEEDIVCLRWFAKTELDIVMQNTYENIKIVLESLFD